MQKKLIIGLGNPGSKYAGTRHNLGIDVLRELNVDCFFPSSGMNNSGQEVAVFLKNRLIDIKNVLIVHDELELPLGEVKLVSGGSAKGHNGVRSIQQALGTQEIPRLKLGIGRPPEDIEVRDYVLQRFSEEERYKIEELRNKVRDAMEVFGVFD